ncbi:hypothetical protein B296_00020113 [Ensete ventricosum]|uniref:Uncharacterized protein n=1 Tax=Ensete ventricosum TaxID=4639 RepID=A0A427AZM7_ENSVE|nr:hypothetical protein B296_00020113 [Ensete ventricosum]
MRATRGMRTAEARGGGLRSGGGGRRGTRLRIMGVENSGRWASKKKGVDSRGRTTECRQCQSEGVACAYDGERKAPPEEKEGGVRGGIKKRGGML